MYLLDGNRFQILQDTSLQTPAARKQRHEAQGNFHNLAENNGSGLVQGKSKGI